MGAKTEIPGKNGLRDEAQAKKGVFSAFPGVRPYELGNGFPFFIRQHVVRRGQKGLAGQIEGFSRPGMVHGLEGAFLSVSRAKEIDGISRVIDGGPVFVPHAAFAYGVRVEFPASGQVNAVVNGSVHDLAGRQLAVRVKRLLPPFHRGQKAHVHRRMVFGSPMEEDFRAASVVYKLRALRPQGQKGGLCGLFPLFLQGGGFFVHGACARGQGRRG